MMPKTCKLEVQGPRYSSLPTRTSFSSCPLERSHCRLPFALDFVVDIGFAVANVADRSSCSPSAYTHLTTVAAVEAVEGLDSSCTQVVRLECY